MTTDHTRNPDRLIWLSLLTVMAVALIADQARANLHSAARAEAVLTAVFDDRVSAEAWCRMHRDALSGDDEIGFDEGLHETSALQRTLPSSAQVSGGSRPRNLDASR